MKKLLMSATLVMASSSAFAEWTKCYPTEVAEHGDRVHIRCSEAGSGGIRYFTLPINSNAADIKKVDRFYSAAMASISSGRPLGIYYSLADTTTGPQHGCQTHDCRPVTAFAYYKE